MRLFVNLSNLLSSPRRIMLTISILIAVVVVGILGASYLTKPQTPQCIPDGHAVMYVEGHYLNWICFDQQGTSPGGKESILDLPVHGALVSIQPGDDNSQYLLFSKGLVKLKGNRVLWFRNFDEPEDHTISEQSISVKKDRVF